MQGQGKETSETYLIGILTTPETGQLLPRIFIYTATVGLGELLMKPAAPSSGYLPVPQ